MVQVPTELWANAAPEIPADQVHDYFLCRSLLIGGNKALAAQFLLFEKYVQYVQLSRNKQLI